MAIGSFTGVALGDLDGDGDLDIVLACGSLDAGSPILINQGGAQNGTPGTFVPDTDLAVAPLRTNVRAVGLGDLDGDGDPDLLVVKYEGGFYLETWINQGGAQGGTAGRLRFSSRVFSNNTDSAAVALGDLDGDGDQDAIEIGSFRSDKVWANDGSGVFSQSGPDLADGAGAKIALGDLDGDGDLDAYVATAGSTPDKVWINQGGRQGGTPGTFADSGLALGAANTVDVALGDVNGDGKLDVVVANYLAVDTVFLNQTPTGGNLSLGTDTRQQFTATNSRAVALGDLDRDGDLDAVFGAINGTLRAYLNGGQGVFVPDLTFGTSGSPPIQALALGDLDGDGALDAVAVAGMGTNLWLNKVTSPPPPAGKYASSPPPGTLIDLGIIYYDRLVPEASFTDRWLRVGNIGTGPLVVSAKLPWNGDVHSFCSVKAFDWMDGLANLVGNPVPFPAVVAPGSVLPIRVRCEIIEDVVSGEGSIVVESDDPQAASVVYPYAFSGKNVKEEYLEYVFLTALVQSLTPHAGAARIAAASASTSTCNETQTLSMDQSRPHAITTEIPAALGGGTLQVNEFEGGLTVSLQPIPADPNRCVITIVGGTFTAPSVTLPSGIATGPNTLTFGPGSQSTGVLDLTTGAFTATATGTIVNDLFREGIPIAGSYAGTADIAAGRVSVQSNTQDFIPVSTAADATPPEITPVVSGPLGANGWYVGDVAVSWTVNDPETNITNLTGCTSATITADTAGQTFTCAATSAGGTTTHPGVTVKRDATAPVLSGVPGNLTAEATSAAGAMVTYANPTATDSPSGVGALSCAPASGAVFPLGSTTATCTAQDNAGNVTSAGFLITVRDTTSPALTCPPNVTVDQGQAVNLGTPTVSDAVDATPTVTNNAPATFPVGTTTVMWTAVDDAGNQATCAQQVTVLGAPGDNTVTIASSDPFANEAGLTPGRFRVSRTGSTANGLTVFYTVGGSATPGSDYVALPGVVTIPAGQAAVDILVTPLQDDLQEFPETITVTLTPTAGYAVGNRRVGVVVLRSDDEITQVVSVLALDPTASEARLARGRFLITRVGSAAAALTVSYRVDGTATPGSDYVALPGTVTIPAGAFAALVPVIPLQDTVPEAPETVTLTMAPSASYAVGFPATATVTLASDE